jgi:hypothetical protein
MIIGTVTVLSILLFGGSGFSFEKFYKDFVKNVVEDKTRREQILDLTKQVDEEVGQYLKEVQDVWSEDVKNTFKNFDATEEDYRNMIDKADQSRIAMQQAVLNVRFKVVELMTEDEWNAMYDQIRKKEADEKAKKEK